MFKDEVCDLVQIDLARVRKIRAELVAPEAVQGLAETFSALGDPTRVRILDALSHGELCVCDLAAVLGLSQSAVSHQLRLLRGIRLVRPRRDGRIVFYSLDDQHIMSIFKQTLQHVEEEQRPSGLRKLRRQGAGAKGEGAMSADSAASQAQAHIGCCDHCETDTPAPTGARVRGWFTAVAAILAITGCAIGMVIDCAMVGRRVAGRRHHRWLGLPGAARLAVDQAVLARHQRADGDRRDWRDGDRRIRRSGDGGDVVRRGAVARGAEPRPRPHRRLAACSISRPATCWCVMVLVNG